MLYLSNLSSCHGILTANLLVVKLLKGPMQVNLYRKPFKYVPGMPCKLSKTSMYRPNAIFNLWKGVHRDISDCVIISGLALPRNAVSAPGAVLSAVFFGQVAEEARQSTTRTWTSANLQICVCSSPTDLGGGRGLADLDI